MKPELKMLYTLCENDAGSNTGQNVKFLMKTYDIVTVEELFLQKYHIKNNLVYPLEENEKWKPTLIEELCLAKKEFLDIGIEDEVIEDLLEQVCTE